MRLGSRNLRAALLVVGAAVLLMSGCAKQVPQEVTDVNKALARAKDGCASVYASDRLSSIQGEVDGMNELADAKKYKKARTSATPLLPRLSALGEQTEAAKNDAKQEAEKSIQKLAAAVEAAKNEDAAKHAPERFGVAKSKLEEARKLAADPCKYREAAALADGALGAANQAREMAIAEKQRLEEERLRAEAERRRREEEERRRREEEERLRRFPPTYTVQEGDYLWRITGMEKIYSNPIFWPIIHQANASEIADPDLIYPGQQLSIPRELSEAAMRDRLRVLWGRYAAEGED